MDTLSNEEALKILPELTKEELSEEELRTVIEPAEVFHGHRLLCHSMVRSILY